MSDSLYRMDLLRLAADAHGAGRLPTPHVSGVAFNPACGDRVTIDLTFAHGRIEEIAHETRACVLAQASASILAQTLSGASKKEVEELFASIRDMLADQAPPPAHPFAAYALFAGAMEYTSRHRCVLLPIEAALNAIRQSPELDASCHD